MLRKRQRTARRIATIDMTGFAAVMLALVALFAIPGAIPYRSTTAGISVDLARVNDAMEMPNADREDALFVAITRDGSIFFDGRVKDIAALPPKIRQHLDEGAERKVYLKVDARARYGPVREALGAIRAAGVENVAFLVNGPLAVTRDWVKSRVAELQRRIIHRMCRRLHTLLSTARMFFRLVGRKTPAGERMWPLESWRVARFLTPPC